MTTPLERAAMKWFPVQTTPYQGDSAFVPWDFVAPHEARCQRNHSQSLVRLAERGGLSWGELLDVLTDQPYAHHMAARQLTNAEAAQHVMTMLIEWLRPPAPSEPRGPADVGYEPMPLPSDPRATTASEQSEANKALVRGLRHRPRDGRRDASRLAKYPARLGEVEVLSLRAEVADLKRRVRLARKFATALLASPHYANDPNGLTDDIVDALDLRKPLPRSRR